MQKFRISNAAVADMLDIGRYTNKKWGIEQTEMYLKRLDKAFYTLAEQPGLGRSCDEISYGYKKYAEGKHVIFYRIADDIVIEIIRILHQMMDVSIHILAPTNN